MKRRAVVTFVVALVLISTSVSVLAQPRGDDQDRVRVMRREVMKDNGVARLFCALPDSFRAQPSMLEIKVVQAGRTLVRETLDINAAEPGPVVVEILGDHAKEVERLQAMAAKQRGSVKVVISSGKSVIIEKNLEDLETAKTVTRPPIGTARQINVMIGAPRLKAVTESFQPDPSCVQYCEDERQFCYDERCDPRGSCQFCEEYYWDCYYSCPQICVDPKNVYNWSYGSYQGSYWNGQECFENWYTGDIWGDLWTHYTDVYLVSVYQRTEYCDGSYTDVFLYSYYYYDDCWSDTWPWGCAYPWGQPPYWQCQFPH